MKSQLLALSLLLYALKSPAALASGRRDSEITFYPECEVFACVPVIKRNRVEWWDRHYILSGVHYARSKAGETRGFELSYFRGIGVGGVGLLAAIDETPAGIQRGLGVEIFLTYVGVDVSFTGSEFSFSKMSGVQIRPMVSVGWASLYYIPDGSNQVGLLLKAPVNFDKL